jgi:hypothetical protein
MDASSSRGQATIAVTAASIDSAECRIKPRADRETEVLVDDQAIQVDNRNRIAKTKPSPAPHPAVVRGGAPEIQ